MKSQAYKEKMRSFVKSEKLKGLFSSESSFKKNILRLTSRNVTVGMDPGSWSVKVVRSANATAPFDVKVCVLKTRAFDGVEESVKKTLLHEGVYEAKAAFALADEKTECHDFNLPKLGKKELETAIDWEIKKAIASAEYVYHDVLTHETDTGVNVQCIVAAKDIVKSRYQEGALFGVKPSFLETESSALMACVAAMRPKTPLDKIVIWDLGYSAFRFIFIDKGRVVFTRSLYFGLATLCHQVASQLGVLPQEVQESLVKLPSEVGPESSGELTGGENTMSPVLSVLERSFQELLYTLCEEFRRSEFYVREQKNIEPAEEILLCGGGACLPFTIQYLQKHLTEKKMGILNPFEMAKSLPKGIEVSSGPLWACALGLSLRNA